MNRENLTQIQINENKSKSIKDSKIQINSKVNHKFTKVNYGKIGNYTLNKITLIKIKKRGNME